MQIVGLVIVAVSMLAFGVQEAMVRRRHKQYEVRRSARAKMERFWSEQAEAAGKTQFWTLGRL